MREIIDTRIYITSIYNYFYIFSTKKKGKEKREGKNAARNIIIIKQRQRCFFPLPPERERAINRTTPKIVNRLAVTGKSSRFSFPFSSTLQTTYQLLYLKYKKRSLLYLFFMCCGSLVSIRLLIFLSKWFYAFLKTAILQVYRVQINPYFTIPREKKGLFLFYFLLDLY